jgi:hypothetical protein
VQHGADNRPLKSVVEQQTDNRLATFAHLKPPLLPLI